MFVFSNKKAYRTHQIETYLYPTKILIKYKLFGAFENTVKTCKTKHICMWPNAEIIIVLKGSCNNVINLYSSNQNLFVNKQFNIKMYLYVAKLPINQSF